MTNDQPFIDYYQVLQVDPHCDGKVLESAYHTLAKTYHPDRPETADTDRFAEVIEAYKILRDPEQRAEYDTLYTQHVGELPPIGPSIDVDIDDGAAIGDADDHARILMFLYKKRRENAQNAGVVGFYLQDMLGCSDEHFDFHKWYLKEKGFISLTEHGTLAITVTGVDHVISMSRTTKAEKLLLEQSGKGEG